MRDLCRLIGWMVVDLIRSRVMLEAEIWTLRQQINVLRAASPSHTAVVHEILQRGPYASILGEGYAGLARRRADRAHSWPPSSRRAAPPIYPDLIYDRHSRNLIFEHRFAEGDLERLLAMAAELVEMNVDVIVVMGPAPMQAAKAATTKIPIVMDAGSIDPVGEGLIASFARPGRNITGLTYSDSPERFAKELQVLKDAVGPISRVAILWDLDAEYYRQSWSPIMERAAGQLGLRILGPFQVRNAADIERAFVAMTEQRAEAVLVSAGSVAFPNRTRIGELGVRHRLPIVAAFKEFPHAGSLISYGPNRVAISRRAAAFVGKILKGSNPNELPVE